jgi:hypothetical protein
MTAKSNAALERIFEGGEEEGRARKKGTRKKRKGGRCKLSQDEIIRRRRIHMLDRFFSIRYGRGVGDKLWQFPDDDAGLADLKIFADHYYMNPVALPRIIAERAPWADVEATIQYVDAEHRKYTKKRLGILLNFTEREYKQYGIRTIKPIDMTDDQIAAYTKARKEEKRMDRRRTKGIKERTAYEAKSLSQTKPWVAEGISRTTWYERRTKSRTSVAPVKLVMKDQTCPEAGLGLNEDRHVKKDMAVVPLARPPSLQVGPDIALRLYALGLLEAA